MECRIRGIRYDVFKFRILWIWKQELMLSDFDDFKKAKKPKPKRQNHKVVCTYSHINVEIELGQQKYKRIISGHAHL